MRIEQIDLYRVQMPLVYPFRTAFGNDAVIESVLARMQSGDQVGWGESSPWALPGYSSEFAQGAFLVVKRFLAGHLVGQNIRSGTELQERLGHVKGNPFAKAVLDLAWWDLHAKIRDEPLWQTLGGSGDAVVVGADFGVMDCIDDLLAAVHEALDRGFKRVKLKYRPGWEIEMLEAVRAQFPDAVFHVDCNSAYSLEDLDMLRGLDKFKLAMIEQPLAHDDLVDHATLQQQLQTPICLDESITSVAKTRKAIELGACGWVNIKPGRVGGLTEAKRIHDACAAAGIPCWIGGMLESAIGGNHCLALATLSNIHYPNDIFPTSRFYKQDLAEPEMSLSGPSVMRAQSGPGIGVAPVPDRLEAATVEHWHCTARHGI